MSLDTKPAMSFASTDMQPEPGIDEAPDCSTIISDPDQRGVGLIKYAATCAAKDDDEDGSYHRTRLAITAPSRSNKTPALAESLEQDVLAITYEGETVELVVVEAVYPSWRTLIRGAETGTDTLTVALSPHVLGVLAKTGREFTFTLNGEHKGIHVASIAGLPVRGIAMPIRLHEAEEAA